MKFMYYVNGKYLHQDDAKIPVADLGVVRGFGVFDYLRTYDKKPFLLWDHLKRLKASADQLGLKIPQLLEEIAQIVYKLLELDGFEESGIKIVVTGGGSVDGLIPESRPSLIVMTTPFKPFAPHFYMHGARAITTHLTRLFPQAKTTSYISAIVALQKAKESSADEAIYMAAQGEVLEATTSNLFFFKKGVLITSNSDQILKGITRQVVLDLAYNIYPIEERPITRDELAECEEAFLTSSNKEIFPLSHIDHFSFKIGDQTRHLRSLFSSFVKEKFKSSQCA